MSISNQSTQTTLNPAPEDFGSLAISLAEETLLGLKSMPPQHKVGTKGVVQFNPQEHFHSQSLSSLSPASPVLKCLGYILTI